MADRLENAGAELRLGENYLQNLEVDVIFRTPGMSFNMPELKKALKSYVEKTGRSEMEVFFDLCPATIFAVTGSDGKTTTTTLIAKMLEADGKKVHLGGNIGKPLLPQLDDIGPDDFVVAELSSFQLISMRKSPDVAVVTNIAPNHLDVHKDMQEYVDSKRNIILHQNAFSRTVLNYDNEITHSFKGDVRGQHMGFSMRGAVKNGAYMDENGDLYMAYRDMKVPLMNKKDISVLDRFIEDLNLSEEEALSKKQELDSQIAELENKNGEIEAKIEEYRNDILNTKTEGTSFIATSEDLANKRNQLEGSNVQLRQKQKEILADKEKAPEKISPKNLPKKKLLM